MNKRKWLLRQQFPLEIFSEGSRKNRSQSLAVIQTIRRHLSLSRQVVPLNTLRVCSQKSVQRELLLLRLSQKGNGSEWKGLLFLFTLLINSSVYSRCLTPYTCHTELGNLILLLLDFVHLLRKRTKQIEFTLPQPDDPESRSSCLLG